MCPQLQSVPGWEVEGSANTAHSGAESTKLLKILSTNRQGSSVLKVLCCPAAIFQCL